MISSSLTIPTSKEILEFKYQVTNNISLSDQCLQHTPLSTVDRLRQHVRRFWVMAETGNPQFVMASNPLSTASGVIVASCKLIWLIAIVVPVSVIRCLNCWKSMKASLSTPSISARTNDMDEDIDNYVLQIDNDMELAEKTLKGISNSMNSFILKAAKEENHNLLELLDKSTGFKGVELFDNDLVRSLLSVELVNSISYTHLVDESLNLSSEYVSIRKASMSLWSEVENKWKWLGNPLAKDVFKGKTSREILKWFTDKSIEIVTDFNQSTNREQIENLSQKLIAANSMYRITQTMLLRFQSDIKPITKKKLFAHLQGMIGDIFSACFTNIPRVITLRCHESVIEKREASVRVAANLLGKTTKIIEKLETLESPSMDDDKMADIDEWRLYLKQYVP
ncbi:hypothetical protein E3N88_40043 [Mikania micrantha]|uniref:Uncharacterized protein n=1 Tax=Mikania micrantha TaxID=192012 RepID=A0A5N6LLJ2_9ASTR|nr:hypothetical protein E3N88_40043 [Mikania micrantha]